MNSFYGDHVLARSIARERTYNREYIQIETFRKPFVAFKDMLDRVVSYVKEKLQEPTLVPVYCFEYAPDC